MLFQWNIYSGLLFPCFVQGVLFATIYFVQASKDRASHWAWLAGIILFYTLFVASWMIGFAGWYDSHDGHTTFAFYFPWVNWFMIGPLVYFYFRTLTNRQFRFSGRHWWHLLLPLSMYGHSVFQAVADLLVIREFPAENFYGTFGPVYAIGEGVYTIPLQLLGYVSIFYYFIATIRYFQQYDRYLVEHFSETEHLDFRWLRNVLYVIVVIQVIWVVFEVAKLSQGDLDYDTDWYKFMATGMLIYYLSLAPFRSEPPQAWQLAFDPGETASAEEKEHLNPELSKRILRAIEEQALYLRESLTLDELARALGESSTTVSKALNEELGQNFNACINRFRVAEAQRRLANPDYDHLSILGIAYDCGFSSKATFNRVFKQVTGQSPSVWRKSQITERGSNS